MGLNLYYETVSEILIAFELTMQTNANAFAFSPFLSRDCMILLIVLAALLHRLCSFMVSVKGCFFWGGGEIGYDTNDTPPFGKESRLRGVINAFYDTSGVIHDTSPRCHRQKHFWAKTAF